MQRRRARRAACKFDNAEGYIYAGSRGRKRVSNVERERASCTARTTRSFFPERESARARAHGGKINRCDGRSLGFASRRGPNFAPFSGEMYVRVYACVCTARVGLPMPRAVPSLRWRIQATDIPGTRMFGLFRWRTNVDVWKFNCWISNFK